MNGIDVSRWQGNIDLSIVPADFVIVKATQGTSYVSSQYLRQIQQAESAGRLLGVYHYASKGGAIPEAEHFLKTVKDYIGKAILCLDWEGEDNDNFGSPQYAIAFLKYVEQKTGIKPFIYMSKSVCRQYASMWDATFPLWCAQYANYQYTGYKSHPWTDNKGFGAWKDCQIYQYSSRGRLPGYNRDLDLDLAYITPEQWKEYARGEIITNNPVIQNPLLKKGDKNEYVRHWQMFLNQNGYNCGAADGIFGAKTEAAVKKWQKDHGLTVDGIIGKQTWGSLQM